MSEADEEADGEDEQTFDITLTDMHPEVLALFIASLGQSAMMAAQAGRDDHVAEVMRMQSEILKNHQEASRRALVDYDFVRVPHLPDKTEEMLDIEAMPDGTVRDTREFTDIDID